MKISLKQIWQLARIGEAAALAQRPTPLDQLQQARMEPLRRLEVNRQIKAIGTALDELHAVHQDAIQQHGQAIRNGDGEVIRYEIRPDMPTWSEYVTAMEALWTGEADMPGERFSLTELRDCALSGDALDALGFLFTECE